MKKSICVIGLGYIGLPTASLLGTKGYQVIGVDTSKHVVDTINDGNVHIVEPDLDILVKSAVQSGHLHAVMTPQTADVYVIAVPTPLEAETKRPDVSYVEAATRSIAPLVKAGDLVLLESTVPVGTTVGSVQKILRSCAPDSARGVHLAHCPERVLPGRVLSELVDNDRIIGGVDAASADAAAAFYEEFVRGQVYKTDAPTAEMAKLAENTFRDVNIALANELSIICDRYGVDPWGMIDLANRHPRVNILQPGPGVGGHCIAVDPWFIVDSAPEDAHLIRTAREVNDGKPEWVLAKVRDAVSGISSPVIACLGLAFKADVDDLRGSPAAEIVSRLHEERVGRVVVCEPNHTVHPEFQLTSLDAALAQADVVLLLVDHKEFRVLTLEALKGKIVIDTRGAIR